MSLLPVEIRKPIDKATPLFAQAINDNEKMKCVFSFYRTAQSGGNELYFEMSLKDAIINNIRFFYPNSLNHNEINSRESVSFKFASIEWEHVIARTSEYMVWQNINY